METDHTMQDCAPRLEGAVDVENYGSYLPWMHEENTWLGIQNKISLRQARIELTVCAVGDMKKLAKYLSKSAVVKNKQWAASQKK